MHGWLTRREPKPSPTWLFLELGDLVEDYSIVRSRLLQSEVAPIGLREMQSWLLLQRKGHDRQHRDLPQGLLLPRRLHQPYCLRTGNLQPNDYVMATCTLPQVPTWLLLFHSGPHRHPLDKQQVRSWLLLRRELYPAVACRARQTYCASSMGSLPSWPLLPYWYRLPVQVPNRQVQRQDATDS